MPGNERIYKLRGSQTSEVSTIVCPGSSRQIRVIDFAPLSHYNQFDPTEVLLIVEVADTSLEYDRDVKGPLYAVAGIQEYRIVNLEENPIEIYREPQAGAYRICHTAQPGERIAPQALPESDLSVEQVLP